MYEYVFARDEIILQCVTVIGFAEVVARQDKPVASALVPKARLGSAVSILLYAFPRVNIPTCRYMKERALSSIHVTKAPFPTQPHSTRQSSLSGSNYRTTMYVEDYDDLPCPTKDEILNNNTNLRHWETRLQYTLHRADCDGHVFHVTTRAVLSGPVHAPVRQGSESSNEFNTRKVEFQDRDEDAI